MGLYTQSARNMAILRQKSFEAKKDLVALAVRLNLEIFENPLSSSQIIFVKNKSEINGISPLVQSEEGGKKIFRSDTEIPGVKCHLDNSEPVFSYVLEIS